MFRTTLTALAAAALFFGAASVTQVAAATPACNSSYEGTSNDEYDPDPDFTGTTNDEYDPDPEYSGTSNKEYDPDPEFAGSTDSCQA
ncbi:hypothetical protein ACH47B_19810 [Rhodococcus sp. NPDC019627]|jgi:hypothetical protein|uniref:Uncharacterized protein n=1 Tax=Rhodococcus oxybenzonivorans TaxID=1990687 RepID=A0A2S2BZS7_9NOCA|nr:MULTISPECIES: hypothetical protein [Rhodococcus]AWK74146.1 hypothetical protein CBI38_23935 [Rhodococcus oxybenzonivorans]QHE71118.1 hypothetical protein GFS60_04716 [Rhodococcus sp. WAY2]QTJ68115.1 hypothetical protein HYG77_22750 [Rhodococcus sp. ZPP]